MRLPPWRAQNELFMQPSNVGTKNSWAETWTSKTKKQTGRPPTANIGAILQSVENQPDLSTRKRASDVGTSHDTVWLHLKKQGYKARTSRWVPHELTQIHLQQRVNVCQQLLLRQHAYSFLGWLVTVDKTWVHYSGKMRKVNWIRQNQPAVAVPKPNPMGRRLC